MDSAATRWKRSSYSGGNGNCVEVALGDEGVSVRDSKEPFGPVLTVSRGQWAMFVRNTRTAPGRSE
ncbi:MULTISPECIES: DUF397 domain-containing protein [unclassified Actinopolyspora]|uniref:DUF397 domain-containing protein n=1 Tax=unclassified Actinopolyspora TaxID=2639451 RepID=UPI0013F5A1BB|nr:MULTISPECIES: DUF397 domain-containing protein [unclassified Actinopolyspora]NHD17604.1 DUF397 domain-containing protein [Actinopolyspora sp. BKK2]NHE76663.1 DUF397 domain-containing protein [Actinopolyspora sp. BKK1]